MLQAAANIAPRGVYVCGNTTTTSGLTVTLSKESGSGGDYALEAGALVLADQGRWYVGRGGRRGTLHLPVCMLYVSSAPTPQQGAAVLMSLTRWVASTRPSWKPW